MIAFYYYYIGLNSISRSALAWYVQTGGNVSDEGAPTKDQFESERIDYPPPGPGSHRWWLGWGGEKRGEGLTRYQPLSDFTPPRCVWLNTRPPPLEESIHTHSGN